MKLNELNAPEKPRSAWTKAGVYASVLSVGFALYGCQQPVVSLPSENIVIPAGARSASVTYPSALNIYYQNWYGGDVYDQYRATSDLKYLTYWDDNATTSIKIYDTPNFYKALRVKFPANKYGGQSGIIIESELANANEYTLEYKVYFEPGFQFNRGNTTISKYDGGGKLPGLCGGSRPSGGLGKTDGMSARIMWRKDGRNASDPNGGYLELYQYWRAQTEQYGDRFYLQKVQTGRWYFVKMRVNLGTSTTPGKLKVWVDGISKIDQSFQYLEQKANWQLNGTMFHAFYGGNTSDWAPSNDSYLMIDNFRVNSTAF